MEPMINLLPLRLSAIGCAAISLTVSAWATDLATPFQAELDALRAEYALPGATAAYVLPDGTSGSCATGWSDVERKTPMTPRSVMPSASIGKTYLGALAVALADEGRIDLDAPVMAALTNCHWLARLPHHDVITLRHLLNHTSGLRDHVYTERFAADVARRWREPDNPFAAEALIAYLFDQPPRFAPGEGWAYSDTGFVIAGLLIEATTGHSCHVAIQQRFLGPLNLRETWATDRRAFPGLAAGYTSPENPLGLPAKSTDDAGHMSWHPGMEGMGGGWASTAHDLARWGHALFAGKAIAASARRDLLQTVAVGNDSETVRYGAGVALRRDGPHGRSLGHGGWIPGYCSSLRHYTDIRMTLAFQINTDIGITDDSADVMAAMERRLVAVLVAKIEPQGDAQP